MINYHLKTELVFTFSYYNIGVLLSFLTLIKECGVYDIFLHGKSTYKFPHQVGLVIRVSIKGTVFDFDDT